VINADSRGDDRGRHEVYACAELADEARWSELPD